jgi:hypothetical protein
MTNTTFSFSFNGQCEKWNEFDKNIICIAHDAIPGVPFGIVGALITPAEYALLNPATPYVAVVDPGPRPLLGVINPTNNDRKAHEYTIKVWEFEYERYIKEQAAISKFKANLLSSIDENSKRLVNDPINGTMVISIRQIRNVLKQEFGILSPTDVDKLFDKATSPYTAGTDMRVFLYSKAQDFAELAAVGEIYGVQSRTRFLIASIKVVGDYDDTILFWQKTYPTLESQVANASFLSSALIAAHAKNKSSNAGSRHLIALTVEDIDKKIQAGITAGIAAAAKEAASESTCTTCKAKVTVKGKTGRPLQYCTKCYSKYKADKAARAVA